MFTLAITIGIYSYLLFFLGIIGLLYQPIVIGITILFFVAIFLVKRSVILNVMKNLKRSFANTQDDKLYVVLLVFFLLQVVINFIGVLAPELAFDALWYHLTLPKIWLGHHSIFFIPGGLLYYSAMPKLAEMLYIGALSFGTAVVAKSVHFSFGLLTCLAIYLFSRKFFTPFISLIAVVIFYANIVVAWESTTAYIDLVRAFFEILALWSFMNWATSPQPSPKRRGRVIEKWLLLSAVMIGFAITTKLLENRGSNLI